MVFLFWIGLCIVSIGSGRIFTRKLAVSFTSTLEEFFYTAGLGFGIIGYAVFLLASFQLLYPGAFIILAVIFMGLALWGWRGFQWQAPASIPNSPLPRPVIIIVYVLLAVFLLVGFFLVFTPEVGKDALIYHLAVPKLYWQHHGFYFIEGNAFANYPLLTEMIYAFALFLSGDVLPKAMHFAAFLLIMAGMWSFCRFRLINNDFPALAVLIFASIPTVFLIASWAYIDLFTAYYIAAAVFAFIIWSDANAKGWLVLGAVFSGLACATKYTSLLLPLLGVLGILWTSRNRHASAKNAIKNVFLYVLLVIAAGIPFYVKNYVLTGNPLSPFFFSLFGGQGWDAAQARYYDLFVSTLGMGRSFIDHLLLPWNLSFNAEFDSIRFDGVLGPVFFLILPFALGLRKAEKSFKLMLAFSAFMFIFWAATAQQVRYLIPIFPLLSICVASIWTHYRNRKIILVIVSMLIVASLAYNAINIAQEINKMKPFGVVAGLETKDEYLKRRIPSYGMFQYINLNLSPDASIFMIYMKNYGYLCERKYYSDSMFESYKLEQILSQAGSAEDAYARLRQEGFTHLLGDLRYLYGPLSTLSAAEMEKFRALEEKYLQTVYAENYYRLFSIVKGSNS